MPFCGVWGLRWAGVFSSAYAYPISTCITFKGINNLSVITKGFGRRG